MGFVDFLSSVFQPVVDLVGKFSDNSEKKAELSSAVSQAQIAVGGKILEYESKIADLQSANIIAEVNSTSWITKSWRPITALCFVAIVVFNYVGSAFGLKIPPIDPDMWAVIKIMIGGYTISRGFEKIVPTVAQIVQSVKNQ